jgi:hypothetical protein
MSSTTVPRYPPKHGCADSSASPLPQLHFPSLSFDMTLRFSISKKTDLKCSTSSWRCLGLTRVAFPLAPIPRFGCNSAERDFPHIAPRSWLESACSERTLELFTYSLFWAQLRAQVTTEHKHHYSTITWASSRMSSPRMGIGLSC